MEAFVVCERAMFSWNEITESYWDQERRESWSHKSCPRVVPLVNDADNPWEYRCDVEDFSAHTARGNLYAFEANVSCVQYTDVSFAEDVNGTAVNYTRYNVSDPVPGFLSVPTLAEGGGYGPGLLTNQTLLLEGSTCFQETGEFVAQPFFSQDSPQYCEQYRQTFGPGGGVMQPLECCIGEIDVILPSDMKTIAWLAATVAGSLFVGYLICRCIIQACATYCCPRLCCVQDRNFRMFRAPGSTAGPPSRGRKATFKKVTTTCIRIGAVSLSLLGFGLNAIVSARYFSFRTILMGVIYETVVGVLEGFSAFWIGDGHSLNAVTAETNNCRNGGIILCTLFLAAYLISVGYDIRTRQTCGFDNMEVMFGVGAALYAFLGFLFSACGKSLGYAQQIFTDNLAVWPAVATTVKCEPPIRIAIIAGAMLLGWAGTALVVIYGEAMAVVTGG